MIDRLVEMFKNMGMSLNKEQVKGLMKQFKSQFENMGLDAEKLSSGDVNFNFDLSNLSKMFQSGQSLDDILGNLGMDVKVDAAPVEIDTPDLEESNDEILNCLVMISIWTVGICRLPLTLRFVVKLRKWRWR